MPGSQWDMCRCVLQIAVLRSHPFSHSKHCNIAFSADSTFLFTGTVPCGVHAPSRVDNRPWFVPGGQDGFVYGYNLAGIVTGDELKAMNPKPKVNPPLIKVGYGLQASGSFAPESGPPDAGLKHNGPINAIAWHPTSAMLATGCTSLCLWTPPPT